MCLVELGFFSDRNFEVCHFSTFPVGIFIGKEYKISNQESGFSNLGFKTQVFNSQFLTQTDISFSRSNLEMANIPKGVQNLRFATL